MHKVPRYALELKSQLPAAAFQPVPFRLLGLPIHLAIIALCFWAIATGSVPWPLIPVLSLVIAVSFAGLMFLGHETLHGAVVKNRLGRDVVGSIAFMPFVLSPRLWCAWHNRTHHAHTNHSERDPDAYPTLLAYQSDRSIRVANAFAPGGGSWFSLLLPFGVGFSIQSMHVLICAHRWGYLSVREHRLALLQTALSVGLWVSLAVLVGPLSFLFMFVIPLVITNAIVMSFILTNHTLSPLTHDNDALRNTLSVSLPPVLEWLTLNFGYHVEHHVFPSMSAHFGPQVRALLLERWPDRYQTLPLGQAISALRATSRVYKDSQTLVDPHTGEEWPTLGLRSPTLSAAPPRPSVGPVAVTVPVPVSLAG